MDVLQEDAVRQLFLRKGIREIHVSPAVYVTPQARAYISEKGLALVVDGAALENREIRPAPEMASGRFQTEDGRPLAVKPEHMTHLYGNVLVAKTHPRIVLRGKLDSLEAEILCLQAQAAEAGRAELAEDLGELMDFCRHLMESEVTAGPLREWKLLGLDQEELRRRSQHPREYYGIGHPRPEAVLGIWYARLNRLRALSRETELAAVTAFLQPDGSVSRPELVQGYNRMSSAIYLIMLRLAAERKRQGDRADE